jgi:hypothetical protein
VRGYQKDLTYIHDVGFSDYSLSGALDLLRISERNGVSGGLVVDLGCGRGSRGLNRAGYQVRHGSVTAMIRLARRNAPACDSWFDRSGVLTRYRAMP